MPAVPTSYQDFFRVSNTIQNGYDGRILLFEVNSNVGSFLLAGSNDSIYGVWTWSTSEVDSDLFPPNQWVFVALATNYTSNTQNGFRYTLSSTTNATVELQNRVPAGASYALSQDATIYVGGSPYCTGITYTCSLQYVRLYVDYFPNSQDEMINLALMDTGTLYILYFKADTASNDDSSSIPVLSVGNSSNSTTTASEDSTSPPQLEPYNTLNCISMSMLSLTTGVSSIDGMVVAMDVKPLDDTTSDQTIFSIRDNSNDIVPIAFTFEPPSSTNVIVNYDSGQNAPIAGPTLTPNAWNRLVVEIVQAQPTSFGVGFSTFRAWVNGTGGMSRIPIGDFASNQIAFPRMNDATLDLCARKTYGTSYDEAGFTGDILNLLWYKGAEGLYVNSSDPNCALSGFLYPNQRACLQCNTGYYFYDMTCINSCPNGTYTHEETKSCLVTNTSPETVETISPETIAVISSIGTSAKVGLHALAVASSILPTVTGGLSMSAILLVEFTADVNLFKYINVPFPDNFVIFCQNMDALVLPNFFARIDVVNGGNNPSSKIGKFQFWDVSATLLDNSYILIFKELIALAIILLSNILFFMFKGSKTFGPIFMRIRNLFMWNVFLSFYLGDFPELQLYSMIQMRENYVSSDYADLSLAFAIIIVIGYFGIFVYMAYRLNKKNPHQEEELQHREVTNKKESEVNKSIPNNSQSEIWTDVPERMKIAAQDFRQKNRFTRNFMLVMLMEMVLLVFLDFFFQDYGLAQAVIYIVLTIVYVCLIAWQRPFKSRLQTAILLLNQSTKIVMGIIAIIYGANEQTQSISPQVISYLGYALIGVILIVLGINLIISIALIIVSIYKKIKQLKSKGKISDLAILNENGKNEESNKGVSCSFPPNRIRQLEDNLIEDLSVNLEDQKSPRIEQQTSLERIPTLINLKKVPMSESEIGVNDQPRHPSKAEGSSDEARRNQSETRRSLGSRRLDSFQYLNSIQIIDLSNQKIHSRRIYPERTLTKLKGLSSLKIKNTDSFPDDSPRRINLEF